MLQTTIANAIAGQALVASSMWKQAFRACSQAAPENSGINVENALSYLRQYDSMSASLTIQY